MRTILLRAAAIGAAAAGLTLPLAGLAPASSSLTIDDLVAIKHPSRPTFSPDGHRIAFLWDRGGVQNVWVASATGGEPVALTHYDTGLIDTLFWTGENVTFVRAGQMWQVAAGAEPRRLWSDLDDLAGVAPSPDGTRVAFERGGDLWVRDLDGRDRPLRLTDTAAVETAPVWSPDASRIAFTSTMAVPHDEAPPYVGAKLRFAWFERNWSDVGVVPARGGNVVIVGASPAAESAPAWIDDSRVALQRVSEDLRTRSVLVGDAKTGEVRTVDRDIDQKWWSVAGSSRPVLTPSPDGRWIAFISDRDGWDHLYVVAATGSTPAVQITRGPYEVRNIAWSPDGTRLAFDTNEGPNPGVRQLVVAAIGSEPAAAKLVTLTSGRGTNVDPTWAPDSRQIVYQHTDPQNSADLFLVSSTIGGSKPQRLTDSFPPGIDRAALVPPELVHYRAADGQQVPAWLFVPRDLDRSRKHPAIVWVHGDGTNQNYDGWHVQRNYAVYYSLHQYLVQRGYVVLAVDYRGSIGYGKAWRQGHYRDLGGKDYEDVAAGAAYLKTLGYVDGSRIGLWGLSYGGFMTLQGLTVTPDLFRCGIDVAGVEDWADWYKDPDGPWIKGRMGSPSENPEIYRQTAPIYRVDRIVRPLLVLAGTADVNVPFLESVRLIDALLKHGKQVDFMMYPGEFHYFQRAHVLRDAWRRVDQFFERNLQGAAVPQTQR